MADSWIGDLLGEISVAVLTGGSRRAADPDRGPVFGNGAKLALAATAIGGYAIARYAAAALGLPAVPGVSSLLLQNQPFYAWPAVTVILIVLVLLARAIAGAVRADAALFCAVLGLLALPTRGGDTRNALLDNGGAGVYLRMALEQGLLAFSILLGYVAMYARADISPAPEGVDADTTVDRLSTVGIQALVTLALLAFLGQSPVKGQALFGTALAAGLSAFVAHRVRGVRGSIWYVAGTLLAGFVAYLWTFLHPQGVAIGDTSGILAGAARALPLHYATAGVAGAIYGYWIGTDLQAEREAA